MPKKRLRLLPDATPLERFQDVFFSQWKELLSLRQRVLKKSDPDDIHDLRIALRRFRVALKLFEYFTSSQAKKKFKKSLRKLTKNMGNLRNIDEAFLFFQPRVHFSDSTQLYRKLSKMRSLELRQIKKLLYRFDHQFDKIVSEMMAKLKIISFTEEYENSLLTYFSNASNNFSKTIHEILAVSTITKQPELRHALRIAIKKWRYFLEIITVVLNRNYDKVLSLFKKYQSILGQLNDVEAFGTLCRDMALPSSENKLIEICLFLEEKLLLKQLTKLIRDKSLLSSRFQIRIRP